MTICDLVRGDKNYYMVFHLEDVDGSPLDLSDGTIEVRLKLQKYGEGLTFSKLGEIMNEKEGICRFKIEDELLKEWGDYFGEIEISWLNSATVLTIEGIGVHITKDLPR